MTGMSMKEIHRIVSYVEPQGVTCTRTKKGILLRLPDRSTTMVHFTTSDVRARANLRATLRRAGVSMPTDRTQATNELPPYITGVKPSQKSKDRAQASLDKLSSRKVTTKQLVDAGGAPNIIQASQVLYALGWLPSRTQRNAKRYWVPPVETDPEPVLAPVTPLTPAPAPAEPEAEAGDVVDAERELRDRELHHFETEEENARLRAQLDTLAPEEAPAEPAVTVEVGPVEVGGGWTVAGEAVQAAQDAAEPRRGADEPVRSDPKDREFLDTADSWAAMAEQLPGSMTFDEARALLGALGLKVELRVWR